MRGRSLVVLGVLAVTSVAHADPAVAPAWLCLSPRKGPFNECTKGNSLGEEEVERCLVRQRQRRPRPSRVRIDDGAWIELPRQRWRCVPLPTDHAPKLAVENYGRVFATWRVKPSACASGVVELVGPNFYGAMYTRCSKRDPSTADGS